jgi:hypothetical protein
VIFIHCYLICSPYIIFCAGSYPITMAEWCPEENMGDYAKLVLRFNEDAASEGLDIDTDQLILLDEAVEGGWTE